MGLEIEDMMVIGVICVGALLGGEVIFPDRYLVFLPLNWALMLMVLLLGVPALSIFKYGKPRGYMKDLIAWYTQPRAYAACEHDTEFSAEYLSAEED
jgi:hypothetical protein